MRTEEAIKELGVWEKFEAEVIRQHKASYGGTIEEAKKFAKNAMRDNVSVSMCFDFGDTEDGIEYWWNIDDQVEQMKKDK